VLDKTRQAADGILVQSLLIKEDMGLSVLLCKKHFLVEIRKHVISADLLSIEAIRTGSRERNDLEKEVSAE
jgi:hypothetical protein